LIQNGQPYPKRVIRRLADCRPVDAGGKDAGFAASARPVWHDAVQLDEWVVVFASEPIRRKTASYPLAVDGAARHVVLDLEPGAYQVRKDKTPLLDELVVEDNDFSLAFRATGAKGDVFAVVPKH
jgi:hypothetical protein